MPEKKDSIIEARIGSSREDFAERVIDAIGEFDDSQDLDNTDPELLKYSPFGANKPFPALPSHFGEDWSASLNGTLH